ncbi:hypothetical protein PBY51_010710 [Eleginops maclovinus]|uniref:Uncharacterized protein n=1 Tax=Eleginops maclovinus TaxID=56733 RepID=A0AAN7X705_ELEMC|nr:hypothetical protein PBY51_010710 [Eleginops maclovinus]
MPGPVTAPVGLPSSLPAFLSLCLSWWPSHPHCNGSNHPHHSSLPVIRAAAPEKPPSCTLLFHTFPLSFRPMSRSGFEPLCRGVMFTPLLHGLCCRLGQASCCSSNSIVLNGDVGRIKLVIFQAWSVLGRYVIRECKAVKKKLE